MDQALEALACSSTWPEDPCRAKPCSSPCEWEARNYLRLLESCELAKQGETKCQAGNCKLED